MSEDDLSNTLSSIDACLARLEDGTQQIDARLVRIEGIAQELSSGLTRLTWTVNLWGGAITILLEITLATV